MELEAGTQLGRFCVGRLLSSGRHGDVYLAEDMDSGRDVAIRIFSESVVENPDVAAQVMRAARSLRALRHPALAGWLSYEAESGVHFMAMEPALGPTLAQWFEAAPRSVPETVRVFLDVASALEAAHEAGALHADLRPEKIAVVERDGGVGAQVLDVGLALSLQQRGDALAPEYRGEPPITPYSSPELRAEEGYDRRTDLWSLGACLAAALCEDGAATLAREPTTPWPALASGLPSAVPERLRLLMRRCLNPDLSLRWRDAGDARIELFELLEPPADV